MVVCERPDNYPKNVYRHLPMRSIYFAVAFLIIFGSSSCAYRHQEWRSVFRPSLTQVKTPITVRLGDGSTRSHRLSYLFTPSRAGSSIADAIEIQSYNMISGRHAEEHLLAARFDGTPWTEPQVFHQANRVFHVFPNRKSHSDQKWIWIDATDYCDVL